MILVVHNDDCLDIETEDDARWELKCVLDAIDDGRRGLEGLADLLEQIIKEFQNQEEDDACPS
jgi:hypothetical protein